MNRCALAVPTLLLCSCATAATQAARPLAPADFVVRGIEANVDSARVVALLGAPDSVSIEPNPFDPASHLAALVYPAARVQTADGKVLGVRLTGPGVATARGLRVGDTAERLRRLYGEPNGRLVDSWEYPDPDDPTGHHVMRVTVANGRIIDIYLGWVLD